MHVIMSTEAEVYVIRWQAYKKGDNFKSLLISD